MADTRQENQPLSALAPATVADIAHEPPLTLPIEAAVTLVLDLWKIAERARADHAGERVLAACERAVDRLRRSGFEVQDLTGRLYDTNMQVQVIEHEGGETCVTIVECLSPAIYYQGRLVRPAEVITKGS